MALFKKQLHYTKCSNDSVYVYVCVCLCPSFNIFKSFTCISLSLINNVTIRYDLRKDPTLSVSFIILWNINPSACYGAVHYYVLCLCCALIVELCMCVCVVMYCVMHGRLFGKAKNSDGCLFCYNKYNVISVTKVARQCLSLL